jgi:predicted nucleotidyltransferase
MRLTPAEVAAIKAAAAEAFGPDAVVRLFGSRVHDHLRGGDIDLHVEVDGDAGQDGARSVFEERLFERIEPRKVDLIVSARGGTPRGFERVAYRDGIVL